MLMVFVCCAGCLRLLDINTARETQRKLMAMMQDENRALAKAASLVWLLSSEIGLANLSAAACLVQTCADALQQCHASLG